MTTSTDKKLIPQFNLDFLSEQVWNFKQNNLQTTPEIDELLHLIDVTFREVNKDLCTCCACADAPNHHEAATNLAYLLDLITNQL
jgi:hypothetical protein